MTTYFEVNSALHAYNSAAIERGHPALSANDVITRCRVPPRIFFEDCNAVRQARTPPPLTPDLEALAAGVLRDLENETAAVLSGRSNGAGGGDGPRDDLEASDDGEAGDAIGANADDDDDEIEAGVSAGADADSVDAEGDTGSEADSAGADAGNETNTEEAGADAPFGEEFKSFEDLIAEAETLAKGDADGARRLIKEGAQLDFDPISAAELLDAIQASTKVKRGALTGFWRRAEKQAVWEAKQAEAERQQAEAERERAEAAALQEQLAERVAPLAKDPNLLARVVAAVHRLGVVREDVAIKATYLTVTSRLLHHRVISLLRRGTAAAGKNYLIEQVLALVPPENIIHISASSAKVLPYRGGDDPNTLAHMVIYIPEASSLLARDGKEHEMAGMLRTLISENKLVYQTVVLREGGQTPGTIEIIKNGPIVVLITSARNNVEDETLTRVAFADADKSLIQSSMVMTYAFDAAGGRLDPKAAEEAEVELLRDLQRWLKNGGPYDVVVPFAPQIRAAFARTPRAVRIRRDIGTLIAGVAASSVLHRAQREVDAKGRVVATLADYEHAWDAFNPGVSIFHNPQFGPGVIALVSALEKLIEEERRVYNAAYEIRQANNPHFYHEPFDRAVTATHARLARELGLASHDTISGRLSAAKEAGLIECLNETAYRSVPRRYRVSIGSAELARSGAVPVFPPPTEVRRLMNNSAAYKHALDTIRAEEGRAGVASADDADEFDVQF